MLSPKQIIEIVNESSNKERIAGDETRYNIYNGHLRDIVKSAIKREFILPETVNELINRIIPVNITQKIVNKLAQVYREAPKREAANGLETDMEALDFYVEQLKVNRKFKWANRLFKLHKHDLWEPYLDTFGVPKVRILPSHTYTLISDDPIEPNRPTIVVKHLSWGDNNDADARHVVWSDDFHYVMNGEGAILGEEM